MALKSPLRVFRESVGTGFWAEEGRLIWYPPANSTASFIMGKRVYWRMGNATTNLIVPCVMIAGTEAYTYG